MARRSRWCSTRVDSVHTARGTFEALEDRTLLSINAPELPGADAKDAAFGALADITSPESAPDVYEPNDSFAGATYLGSISGSTELNGLNIETSTDQDYFLFTASGSGTATVDLSFLHAQGDIDLSIYDSGEQFLIASTSSTDDEHVDFSVTAGQSYYVQVYGFAGATNPNYDMAITVPDFLEPNDSFGTATDLGSLGSYVQGGLNIQTSSDEDNYRFTALYDTTATVDLSFVHANGDIDLYIYDDTYSQVAVSTSVDDNEHAEWQAVAGQTYYIRVVGYLDATNTYAMTVAAVPSDPFEPNDDFGTATDLGLLGHRSEYGLSIHYPGNADYFSFVAAGTGTASVEAYFTHALGDLDIAVYDAAQTPLGYSASSSDYENVNFSVTAGQSYYVVVYGYSGATNPSYDLVIDAPIEPDYLESNDTPATATNLGPLGSAVETGLNISSSSDEDYFVFSTLYAATARVDLAFFHNVGDLDLEILDSGQQQVAHLRLA